VLRRTADDYQPAESYEPYEDEDDAPGRRRRGGRKTTVALLFFALAFLAVAVLRVFGIDGNQFTVPALALSPYITPAGLVLGLIALVLRRRITAVAVLLMALSMAVLLMPRYFSNDQPPAKGQHLRLMSANVNKGRADSAAIVKAVRDNKIDLLDLPELNMPEVADLDQAGLAAELPYRVFDPGYRGNGDGNGIASRFPLREIILTHDGTLSEPAAVVDLPGRDDIEMVAVHIQAAIHGSAATWKRELADLPPPNPARVRVLAGDFNATFDHAAFRGVLDRGYSDAAEQTGNGLTPTWSSWQFGPPITIDHVLVDHRCAVQSYAVWDLPGSDHSAVFAEIVLP
jgi:endonuclease/exonuclease/phosphatase family metal-dependent hydrolase